MSLSGCRACGVLVCGVRLRVQPSGQTWPIAVGRHSGAHPLKTNPFLASPTQEPFQTVKRSPLPMDAAPTAYRDHEVSQKRWAARRHSPSQAVRKVHHLNATATVGPQKTVAITSMTDPNARPPASTRYECGKPGWVVVHEKSTQPSNWHRKPQIKSGFTQYLRNVPISFRTIRMDSHRNK